MKLDALVRIRLFNSGSGGGRVHRPILGDQFGCPVFFDSESGHDARFYLSPEQLPLSPGDEVTVPIKFLCPEEVQHLLAPGAGFRLWETGFFAAGEVVSRLIPDGRGPDPAGGRGAYIDPQTGQQRILSHPDATPPHGHVNKRSGQRIDINGNVVPPESSGAHLPIKVD